MSQNIDPTPDSPEVTDSAVGAADESSTLAPEVSTPELVEPEPVVHESPLVAEVVTAEPVSAEPVIATPIVATPVVAGQQAPAVAPPAPTSAAGHVAVQPTPPREVVYLKAPTPPPARHNRGFGVLISLIGTLTFALLYLGAGAIIISLTPGANVDATISSFASSAAFWIPVAAYFVFSALFALMVDRASWWAHVLGSLFVAALAYAGSVGVLALMYNVAGMTPAEALVTVQRVATTPFLIAAAVLARECALWFGLAIASRGRRVRERNAAERAKFDSEAAEQRAAYERAHSA